MPTLLTGRVSRVGYFGVVSSYDFNDLKNCSPDTEMRQILVKNQGPSRSVKAGLSTDHFTTTTNQGKTRRTDKNSRGNRTDLCWCR